MASTARRLVSLLLPALLCVSLDIVCAALALSATFTSYGPRLYERGTAAPSPVVTSFAIPNPSKSYTLKIYNGGRADIRTGERVSSAVLSLNGTTIVGTQNFNEKIGEISFPIKLLASNQLSVELRSKPGSLLIVEIIGVDNTPVANAGPDQTLFVGNTAQLDGSGSSDVDGDLLSFQWSFVSRPAGSLANLSDPTAVKPNFVIDRPGNYHLNLVVNDGLVDSAPDTVVISTLNSKPVAYAGPDQTVSLGARAFLDGRDSSDVDGDPLSFRWRLVSRPLNSTATLQQATTSQPSFIADKPGSYTIELIVNDGSLDSSADQVVITTENSRPIADAGPDLEALVGDIVQLDGSNSTDADNDPLTYQWSFTAKPNNSTALLSDPKIVNPTFIPDLPGLYVLQLIVRDGKADSLPDTASITVLVPVPPNRNPVAVDDKGPTLITAQNSALTIPVLSNDFDPDGDPIAITGVSQGANGTVTNTASTTTYTPNSGFSGIDTFTYAIADNRGGTAQAKVTVIVNQTPIVDTGQDQTITLPATASLHGTASDDGLPNPPGKLTTQWTQISGLGTVSFGDASAPDTTASFSQAGTYVLRLTADDGFMKSSSDVTITVNPIPPAIPPDPVVIAPPLDTTVPTTLDKSTEFLYTGTNPIQTGVAPGTIIANRAAVVRGKVLDRSNAPISGVEIMILNHPEFGQTVSRDDGMFDMAVNGGSPLTINYKKSGLIPVQRQVQTSWQDFSIAPDVVMIARDTQVTTIALNASVMQVARGSMSTDDDGNRQATVLIPPGTLAQIYRPDGTTQSVDTLNLRFTEFTVGANGPNAMPGELPPTSGYTYAVELAADEAEIKINGKDVLFNQPVISYLENFLDLPVGENVPVGYYDSDLGAWVPSDNGRVVQVVNTNGGIASLDTDGDGIIDNGIALGVTDAERQQLALLYASGQSLWRVPMLHFSKWDSNWGEEPDCDLEPKLCVCRALPKLELQLENSCKQGGNSTIECQNQVLGESVGVVGTGISLNYRSERVPELEITLSESPIPTRLLRIELEIKIAGRLFHQTFPPLPNQRTTFTWDGKDAYGRKLQGAVPITVRIGYTYNAIYGRSGRFGYNGNGVLITAAKKRSLAPITLWQTWQDQVIVWNSLGIGLGGWTPSIHHIYDVQAQLVHRGNGERQSSQAIGPTISTIAGLATGTDCQGGDGGAATQASLCPEGLAVGHDGSIYIATPTANRVRRVAADGIITTFAGTGVACSSPTGLCGDGGLAINAPLSRPYSLAVGSDGSLYIGELDSGRVRRVSTDGTITTAAGSGVPCSSSTAACGDDGPAKLAQITAPYGLAVGPDNSIYISDPSIRRIRRVVPDGIITTVAGSGIVCSSPTAACGDGGPATLADLSDPRGIALGRDGSLYISDRGIHRVRRVTPNGIIRTIAGTGLPGFSGDSGPATDAKLNNPNAVTIAPDDSVYIVDESNRRIRWLRSFDGVINTLAGNGNKTSAGDGGPALQASFREISSGLAIAPDQMIYVAEPGSGGVVRRIALSIDALAAGGFAIPAQDGSEVYIFSQSGRHLQTLDGITSALRYTFGYDSGGRLTSITDRDNNVVLVERNGSGSPTAIIGPFGQRTSLAINAAGYLSRITNPAGESVQMTYVGDGLLSSFTNPRGFVSNYRYDSNGQLFTATDPTGATKTLVRSGKHDDYTVALTTSLGRTTRYRVERLENKDIRLTNTDPSGVQTIALLAQDGRRTISYADGTRVDQLLGPDPRWRMLAPLTKSRTITTPGGKVSSTTTQRTAILTNPSDPLSLRSFTETATINGRLFTRSYDGASRTFITTSPTGRRMSTLVDEKGRTLQRQIGGLDPVTYEYDARGRPKTITQGAGLAMRLVSFAYNTLGFLETITDPLGRITRFSYDTNGRIIQQITPDNRIVALTYDANGNPTSVTPPGHPSHTFSYSPVDLTSSYTPPDIGPGSEATSNSFNADRQLTRVALPNGQSVDLNYDGTSGRISNVNISRGQMTYDYAATSGSLASIAAPDEALAFDYDGSLPTRTTWTGAVSGDINRSYDNNFRIDSQSVSGADIISFQYDNDSLLTGAGSLTLTRNAQNGLITGTTLGNVTDAFAYNGFGERISYSAAFGGTSIFNTQFTRDSLGRITQKTETIGGVTDTFNYSYDLAGRLSEVRKNGTITSTYTYDSNGNRLSGPSGSTTYTYDDQDRLLTTTNSSAMFALPVGRQIDYLVDGGNRRIAKRVNGTVVQKFLYSDRLKPIAELDGNNNIVSRFVYSTGINVPAYMIKSSVTYRIITDQLGSPRLVIDVATGNIAQRIDYGEFGNVTNDTNPGFQPFGFAGGLYDPDTKLVRFGARDYDSEIGRWTAKDPIRFRGGDANLYRYVRGDPTNRVDPLGLWFGDLLDFLITPIKLPNPPCPPEPDEDRLEKAVRDSFGEMIDSQVDSAVENIVGGAKFLEPLDTAVDAAQVSAQGIITVHEGTREQQELIDTILTGTTDVNDYAPRRYYAPTSGQQ